MPTASSSRRRPANRRQNSEDIEMDRPTQTQAMDDVESDDDAPRPTRRNAKQPAAKGKGKSVKKSDSDNEADEEEDEDDEDDIIDVEAFRDQPIQKTQAHVLPGLETDWDTIDKIIRQNWTVLERIGVGLADAAEDDNEPEEIAELDTIMRELVDISAKFRNNGSVLNEMYQKIQQGDQIDDAMERYKNGVVERNEAYAAKTSRQKYSKVPEYVDFKSAIWSALHPDTPMPPLTNFIEKEEGDDSDDDDLEIGGQTVDYKCPITLTLLKDPLTSAACGHSFSAAAIRASFDNPNKAMKCPAAGCRQLLTLSQCKPNPKLAQRVKAYERRIARQEEKDDDSDDEEVID
ncbi:hypothetical protein DFP72DRAFT_1065769 [Ephemerocybe angulata]|uniref:SP-RING-type domain-containing protein n=1 Tax=Ephemerocybe angulata TaxID=980116 RepID=A0A8H6I4Z8_9AGAR|nr:hypothetical protein DFP72DRAFT_1065769 [Tulosesus angulatus]